MKSLKMLLFATVFGLTAMFTVTANAGNKETSGDCWKNPADVGRIGFEDELQSNCPGETVECCYIVNPNDPDNPIALYKLPLQ